MPATLWSQLLSSPPSPPSLPSPISSAPPPETATPASTPTSSPADISSLHLRAFTFALARHEQQLAANATLLNECKSLFSTASNSAATAERSNKRKNESNNKEAAALNARLSGIENALQSLAATVRSLTMELQLQREQIRSLSRERALPAVIQVPASDPANYSEVSASTLGPTAGAQKEGIGPISAVHSYPSPAHAAIGISTVPVNQRRLISTDDLPKTLVLETQPRDGIQPVPQAPAPAEPPAKHGIAPMPDNTTTDAETTTNTVPAPIIAAQGPMSLITTKAPKRHRRLLSSDEEAEFPPQEDGKMPSRGARPRPKRRLRSTSPPPPAEAVNATEATEDRSLLSTPQHPPAGALDATAAAGKDVERALSSSPLSSFEDDEL